MLKWVLLALLIAGFIFALQRWARDLWFYKTNGWDFTKDSGFEMYSGTENIAGEKIFNKERVVFGYPFGVVVILIVLLAVYYSLPN